MSHTLKDSRTALPENSIWLNLPEDTFRQHLVNLESRTNSIPIDPQVFPFPTPSASEERDTRYLPIEIEQEIADSFAFLASVTEGAQSVTAVCIEQYPTRRLDDDDSMDEPSMRLRFATLDSILSPTLTIALRSLTTTLSSLPLHPASQTRTTTTTTLLTPVLSLHTPRILSRLRSTHWTKPPHLSKSHKKPLWKDIPNLLHRVQFLYSKSKTEKTMRREVETLLQDLERDYRDFETMDMQKEGQLMGEKVMNLLQASFTFCSSPLIKDLLSRLLLPTSSKAKPTPQVSAAVKTLRQIQKLASYIRISHSLVAAARKYPELFRKVEVVFVEPYTGVETSVGYEEWARTMHVHAEVGLIVWYDLLEQERVESGGGRREGSWRGRPRCIGTSKHLCYLCYLFLVTRNQLLTSSIASSTTTMPAPTPDSLPLIIHPSKTHGRLYDQWTIPDLHEYTPPLRTLYRNVIVEMGRRAVERWEEAGLSWGGEGNMERGEFWRLMPMTSVEVLECFEDEEEGKEDKRNEDANVASKENGSGVLVGDVDGKTDR